MPRTPKSPRPVVLILKHFETLEDPRIERTKKHSLENILVMALTATLCGANGWKDLAEFAAAREEWFATFLELPYGTPSEDTFARVFGMLKPEAFERCLKSWVNALATEFQGEVVAFDGKALKSSVEKARPTVPIHLLHAWASGQHLLLGQLAVEGAAGECAAIPRMLEVLDLEGAIVTTDANGCTMAVATAVRARSANYVLALKGNRGPQLAAAKQLFENARTTGQTLSTNTQEDSGHGRDERRVVRALDVGDRAGTPFENWTDLHSIACIERTRDLAGTTTTETSFYLSSLPADAEQIGRAIRSHWGIENHLHWSLDTAFSEDRRRIRDKNAAQNFALLARLCLMILKRDNTKKGRSLAMKRKVAGWDTRYLIKLVLSGVKED